MLGGRVITNIFQKQTNNTIGVSLPHSPVMHHVICPGGRASYPKISVHLLNRTDFGRDDPLAGPPDLLTSGGGASQWHIPASNRTGLVAVSDVERANIARQERVLRTRPSNQNEDFKALISEVATAGFFCE